MTKLTPMKAIRKKCLECSSGQSKEVKLCTIKTCPLYAYRNGHRPKDDEFTIENGLEEKTQATRGFISKEGELL